MAEIVKRVGEQILEMQVKASDPEAALTYPVADGKM